MCGIFTYKGKRYGWSDLRDKVDLIRYRGPDNSKYVSVSDDVLLGFHRLAIMGKTELGNQPMKHPEDNKITLVCNGEIYNYENLGKKYNFDLKTGSDCEIILHLYKKFGVEKLIKELDGVFMFVIYDQNSNTIFAGRDPMGVRPGFIGIEDGEIFIASEAKPLIPLCNNLIPFWPGTWWTSKKPDSFNRYFFYRGQSIKEVKETEICKNVNTLLTNAVKKRLMSEREIGCLLSGGLDSSLITSLVVKYNDGPRLNTFSIGLSESVDLKYANLVAKYLRTKHHQIEIKEEEFLNAIETVIYNIESYDTTTVRASVGNYLVSKYISGNSNCKVIFNGDGSDEVCGGYVYLKNAPSEIEFQKESERLVEEIHFFDVLRSDRSISSNGLEPRTPFLDKEFVSYYLSIPPKMKVFDGEKRLEKHILRKAFDKQGLLPDEVLWRRKCAFSDGVSSQNRSWHTIIQSFVDNIITDEEYFRERNHYRHCRPQLKESYFYRKVFSQFFNDSDDLIPHFWMPKWTKAIDPSARELDGYRE